MLEALKTPKILGELASEFGVHPIQIAQWKRQLLGASAGGFENVATSRRKPEPASPTTDVDSASTSTVQHHAAG